MNKDIALKLLPIFETSVIDVIRNVLGIRVEKIDCADDRSDEYAGVLPFSGADNGLFVIKAGDANLRQLTSYMTGADEKNIERGDMEDCIGELANMVCGLSRARAGAEKIGFTLSTPFSLFGADGIEFLFKGSAQTFHTRFSNGAFYVNTRIILL